MFGVYAVRNVVNGMLYIGSTTNIDRRRSEHEHRLNRGKHENKNLQAAWNYYGKDMFVFDVIEEVEDTSNLVVREQFYIDMYRRLVYNMAPNAGTMAGYVLDQDSREKIAKSLRGKKSYCRTEKHKLKMSLCKKGKKRDSFSQEWRQKISLNTQGEGNPNAKLCATDVLKIKQMLLKKIKHTEIAKMFGVSSAMIGRIMRGQAWATVG